MDNKIIIYVGLHFLLNLPIMVIYNIFSKILNRLIVFNKIFFTLDFLLLILAVGYGLYRINPISSILTLFIVSFYAMISYGLTTELTDDEKAHAVRGSNYYLKLFSFNLFTFSGYRVIKSWKLKYNISILMILFSFSHFTQNIAFLQFMASLGVALRRG